jgi:inner membrane protein
MDPLSQAALGAVVGQVAGYRRVGPRAAAIGAAAGMLPDIDVLFSINGSYFDQLLLHRGITHSLLFAPVVGPPLGWAVWRWERLKAKGRPDTRPVFWMLVVSLALLSHPLLDYLTPYGTQLLLPFSDQRFAVAAMPIIDPVYTALLLVGLLCSRLVRSRALLTAVLTLLLSSAYLGYGWHLNNAAVTEARRQLEQAGITNADIAAFPHARRTQIGWDSSPCGNRAQSTGALHPGRHPPTFRNSWNPLTGARSRGSRWAGSTIKARAATACIRYAQAICATAQPTIRQRAYLPRP